MRSLNALCLTSILAALALPSCAPRPAALDGPPDVPLVTQDHEKIHLREKIRGEVVLISFMYTKCDGSCPLTTRNLVKVQEALGDHLGRDVFMYSISLDPAVDTPEVLAQYAKDLGAKPGWTFLTGEFADITRLRRSLGLYDADPSVDADKTEHSGLVVIGNEKTGTWLALAGLAEPRRIKDAVFRVMNPPEGASTQGAERAEIK